MTIHRIEPESRWFFAFWWEFRDSNGRMLRFPSISLGVFRLMWDTDEPWWQAPRFYWNNDD